MKLPPRGCVPPARWQAAQDICARMYGFISDCVSTTMSCPCAIDSPSGPLGRVCGSYKAELVPGGEPEHAASPNAKDATNRSNSLGIVNLSECKRQERVMIDCL